MDSCTHVHTLVERLRATQDRNCEDAADEIERLKAALQAIDDGAQCDWCADIARAALEGK